MIEERDSSHTLLKRYVHGPGTDEIVAMVTTAGTYYFHHDRLGSAVKLTNSGGYVAESYSYDAFGAPAFKDANGNTLSASAVGNRFLFTGREYRAEIALYDYRNRVYSPALGRFLQTDPIRMDAGDAHLYRYVGNKATNGRDPLGLHNVVIIDFAFDTSTNKKAVGAFIQSQMTKLLKNLLKCDTMGIGQIDAVTWKWKKTQTIPGQDDGDWNVGPKTTNSDATAWNAAINFDNDASYGPGPGFVITKSTIAHAVKNPSGSRGYAGLTRRGGNGMIRLGSVPNVLSHELGHSAGLPDDNKGGMMDHLGPVDPAWCSAVQKFYFD